MIRHTALFLLLIAITASISPVQAEELPFNTPPDTTTHHWTGHKPTHVIGVLPLLLRPGGGGSYEQSFGEKHGIYLEGAAGIHGGYVAKLAYLRYKPKSESDPALTSPFTGVYLRYGRMIREHEDGVGNHLDMISLHGGMFFGDSFTMGRYIRVSGRLGLGMPFYWNTTWTPEEPALAETQTLAYILLLSVELGVSVGFMW